ncbi:hypothetical protein GOODEAATRI_029466 [Goodea atripinnis]|uniref:Uncharacterized protein n=1 Tax=Goodea atripinnis TaxID=208336 RepID=A0ABV0P8R3_9TELE
MVTAGFKTSPNHHSSSTVLDSLYEVFVLTCCVFSPKMVLSTMVKHLHIIYPEDIVQGVFSFIQMQLCNLSPATIFFLLRRCSLLYPLQAAKMVQYFSNCPAMTFNLLNMWGK